MKIRFIITAIGFLIAFASHAQTLREFTHEKQAFYDELYKIMNDADRRETKRFMDERFGPFWLNSEIYNAEQTEKIYAVADAILKKRLRPYPFYEANLTCLMSFPGHHKKGKDLTPGQKRF